ncbi:MAG: RHS repeat-associated core domain-containing protein, partial [Gammaproteobacteria bacterium]|nr:RHS repeat-associated core domain-containing protein [Gammaproteobacteria bacterium]
WRADYDPFGRATVDPSLTVEFNVRFPGQYFDAETGLHYNYYRDYDPDTGRYLQPDPIGLAGGLNPYLYVNANPLRFTDPNGLQAGAIPPFSR